METLIKKAAGALGASLGCCPRCMRQSFVFMLAAWSLAILAMLVTDAPLVAAAVTAVAAGATALWLLHLTAFAVRAMTDPGRSKGRTDAAAPVLQPRRQFVLGFAKSFVLVAAATAVPMRTAFAQDRMSQCLTCCARKLKDCGTSGGKCSTLYQNCVAGCNSQGQTPSDWRCW